MSNKEYRELQLSSSQLVLIFIAILVLGIIVFLLGVSVGKKQARIVEETQLASKSAEQITQEKPVPQKEPAETIDQELASHQKAQEDKRKEEKVKTETVKPKVEKSKPQPSTQDQNLFWIQVGAFSSAQNANSVAETYRGKGYNSVVLDPLPTDKKKIYRVRLGGYPTRGQAEKERDELAIAENKKKTDYLIIR
jgi:cell division septation protein DedD